MSRLEQEIRTALQKPRIHKSIYLLILMSALSGIVGGLIFWTLSDLPSINAIEEYVPVESSKVYSSDGKLLAELYFERRTFVPHYKIPDIVKKAFISIEDVRFYNHPGVDFIGILRALWQDIKARSIVQGGSTITQQLAKMLFLKPEKSILRKIKEAAMSIQIEKRYTKDEILGLYLNQTFFGSRAFGIEAAAQTYFGKSIEQVSAGEAALLATLPKAPSLYSPFKNPEKSRQRRAVVLKSMLKLNYITNDQYTEALNEPLPSAPNYRKYEAPYFIELLRRQLNETYGSDIYSSGYKIYSTVDSRMQQIAEEALVNGIKAIEKRAKRGVQASLIALDLRTGHIKALVGGFDFWETQFNRATQALRQPGSAFKPFVYLAAFREGMKPDDVIYDVQAVFTGATPDENWTPDNYDNQYLGEVTLKTGLAKSLNAATVNLASVVGIDNVVKTARELGITSTLHPYISLALGSSDVTLIELVSAYSVFATGNQVAPLAFERMENRDRIMVEEKYPQFKNILDEKLVESMKILLRAVVTEGTATRANSLKRPVFGKTGTTNDYRDAWFIGFDEHLAVGVWVGRDDHTPIGYKETGAKAALPIWIDFMKKVASLTTETDKQEIRPEAADYQNEQR